VDTIFERRELIYADGATRVQSPGGDADLGAEAKFSAIGKLRRRVMQDNGRIDFA